MATPRPAQSSPSVKDQSTTDPAQSGGLMHGSHHGEAVSNSQVLAHVVLIFLMEPMKTLKRNETFLL